MLGCFWIQVLAEIESELLKDSDNWLSLGVNKMIFYVAT